MGGLVRNACHHGEALVIRAVLRAADRFTGPWDRRRRLSLPALLIVEATHAGADQASAVTVAERLLAHYPHDGTRASARRLQRAVRRPSQIH